MKHKFKTIFSTSRDLKSEAQKEAEKIDYRYRKFVCDNAAFFLHDLIGSEEWEKKICEAADAIFADDPVGKNKCEWFVDGKFSFEAYKRTDQLLAVTEKPTEDSVRESFYAKHVNRKLDFQKCYEYAELEKKLRLEKLDQIIQHKKIV